MGQRGTVDRVDPLEQHGDVSADRGIEMRLERVDEPLHLLEEIGPHVWARELGECAPPSGVRGSRAAAWGSVAMVITRSHTRSTAGATASLNVSPNSCTPGSTSTTTTSSGRPPKWHVTTRVL